MTPSLIYSMTVSLDGYIAGPGGDIGWSVPSEELFRFHVERTAELGAHLCGRRLYETMLYWEGKELDPSLGEDEREFARIWNRLPRIVFSRTLDRVQGNARLATTDPARELQRAMERYAGDIEVGGAVLASTLVKLGLVDEYRLFVTPVVLGAGTRYFPPLEEPIELELLETKTFSSRVVYLRYRAVRT